MDVLVLLVIFKHSMQCSWLICEKEFVDRLGTLLLNLFPFLLLGFPLRYLILFIALAIFAVWNHGSWANWN